MTTKKTAKSAKKTAKRKKKRASGAATTQEFNAADLHSAAVVMWGADGLLGAVECLHFDINVAVSAFPVTVQEVSTARRTTGEINAGRALVRLREAFTEADYDEAPYLRVIGKVVEVLTVHRAQRRHKDYCSVGEVFLVFLDEIPQHSPYDPVDYRLPRPTTRGNEFAVTRDPGKRMFAGRLQKLKLKGYLTPANTTRSGSERGYKLTEDGQMLFDGWPDVPGLQLDPPEEHE